MIICRGKGGVRSAIRGGVNLMISCTKSVENVSSCRVAKLVRTQYSMVSAYFCLYGGVVVLWDDLGTSESIFCWIVATLSWTSVSKLSTLSASTKGIWDIVVSKATRRFRSVQECGNSTQIFKIISTSEMEHRHDLAGFANCDRALSMRFSARSARFCLAARLTLMIRVTDPLILLS